jgi:ankyrin repeat protein
LLITVVNEKDNQGNTPLHYAVKNGHKELVDLLLDHSADIDVKNHQQKTPLDLNKELIKAVLGTKRGLLL